MAINTAVKALVLPPDFAVWKERCLMRGPTLQNSPVPPLLYIFPSMFRPFVTLLYYCLFLYPRQRFLGYNRKSHLQLRFRLRNERVASDPVRLQRAQRGRTPVHHTRAILGDPPCKSGEMPIVLPVPTEEDQSCEVCNRKFVFWFSRRIF